VNPAAATPEGGLVTHTIVGQPGDQTGATAIDPPSKLPGPPLVLSHGFTQNTQCWGTFGTGLASRRQVIGVDGPGHGQSYHDDVDLWRAAELLVAAAPPEPSVHIGYSMGGRLALHAALAHPDRVAGLVLIGATAGIPDAEARAARRTADEDLAQQLLSEDLGTFLDRWLANPLFASLPDSAAQREARLTNRPEGLAASLRHRGTGSQESLWHRLRELRVPVLCLVGAADGKFAGLADRMIQAMPNTTADVVRLTGGHAIHLEAPDQATKVVTEWLGTSGLTVSTKR
jgi:2-succinyl-6-hydroxy-2,4-cyclohexadiene-1-carboxylate synthase